MPRKAETEIQRINREWEALCKSQMILLRIPTQEVLAKRLKVSTPTANARVRELAFMKMHDIMDVCKVLHIDMDKVAAIVKGK